MMNQRSRMAVSFALLMMLLVTLVPAAVRAEERPGRLLTPEQAQLEEADFVRKTGKVMTLTGGSAMVLGGILLGVGAAVPGVSCNARECSPSGTPTILFATGA